MPTKFLATVLGLFFVSSLALAAQTKVTCTIETVGERTDDVQTYERFSDPVMGPAAFDLDEVYGQKVNVSIDYATAKTPSSIQSICAMNDEVAVCTEGGAALVLYPGEKYGGQVGDQATVKCASTEVP